MKVGVTGHQKRAGADWQWVADQLSRTLSTLTLPFEGWSSLAEGADQAFARAVLEHGGTLVAVIPITSYEKCFERVEHVREYERLRSASHRHIQLNHPDPQEAFFAAGRLIVEKCDWLLAVWDGKPSQGIGGTADVINYARSLSRTLLIFDPIQKTIHGDRQQS